MLLARPVCTSTSELVTGFLLGASLSVGRVARWRTSRFVWWAVSVSRVVCWNAQLRESSMDLVSTMSALRVDAGETLGLGMGLGLRTGQPEFRRCLLRRFVP
jgi:hypothetical protein